MSLPDNFVFSQSSLQDHIECPRRFELRYIEQLKWPAIEAEPVAERERHMRRGADFHHMIHQHMLGVPADRLSSHVKDPDLRRWWSVYQRDPFVSGLPEVRYPETTLSAWVGKHRLVAKYDLVTVQPGTRVTIVDWKTSRRKPSRQRLLDRMQTVVYRYVLTMSGAHLNAGRLVLPEQVEMVYWFVEDPSNPERFPYDKEQYDQDADQISALVSEIVNRKEFDLTIDTKRCRFCTYRSLCERGIVAGHEDELDEDVDDDLVYDFDLDFDQIAEIEF
jgi:CRISPR/Cas system-associated exonuclease Cas4 (RecB family)